MNYGVRPIKAKAEKEGSTGLTSINGREWHNPTAKMKNLMSAFFPTMELRKDPTNPTFRLIKVKGGADSHVYVNFYMDIDGFTTRNIDYLERYIAEDIAYIGLGGTTLIIRTSPLARYKRIIAERSKGVTVFTYDHLLNKATYTVEDPNQKAILEDKRSTLYWNPSYKISEDNKIEFYTSDLPGDFILTMTGYHPEAGKIELHKKITVVSKAQ